jgi:hypothetical protein
VQVCYSTDGGNTCATFCWGYSGSQGGGVYTCSCPISKGGTWN